MSWGPIASSAVSARSRTAAGRDLQQAGDLVVGAALAQHELQDGLLVGGQIVEGSHAAPEGTRGRAGIVPLPMDPQFPLTFPDTFDGLYGLTVDSLDLDAGEVRAHVDVGPRHKQPAGLVHGGVFASIAESITSLATWSAVQADGKSAQGLSNQTSFLRPILDGTIHAVGSCATAAARRGSGRSTSPTTTSACARSCG